MKSASEKAPAQSFAYRFGFRVNVELLVDAADIIPDRIDAHAHLIGRGLITVPLGQQRQQPLFRRGQWMEASHRRTAFLKQSDNVPGDLRRHRRTAGSGGADGIQQLRGRSALEQVSVGPIADRCEYLL